MIFLFQNSPVQPISLYVLTVCHGWPASDRSCTGIPCKILSSYLLPPLRSTPPGTDMVEGNIETSMPSPETGMIAIGMAWLVAGWGSGLTALFWSKNLGLEACCFWLPWTLSNALGIIGSKIVWLAFLSEYVLIISDNKGSIEVMTGRGDIVNQRTSWCQNL